MRGKLRREGAPVKTVFDPDCLAGLMSRLERLHPDTPRLWGMMDPAGMLAHCAAVLELANGDKPTAWVWTGRILGPLFRKSYSDAKPWPRNLPTGKDFIFPGPQNFDREKARLLSLLKRFAARGGEVATRHPHPFFGRLSQREWGIGMHKHVDHHLRQFGA